MRPTPRDKAVAAHALAHQLQARGQVAQGHGKSESGACWPQGEGGVHQDSECLVVLHPRPQSRRRRVSATLAVGRRGPRAGLPVPPEVERNWRVVLGALLRRSRAGAVGFWG